MTLSPWDLAELDRLAIAQADRGKTPAWHAYTKHAIAQGWGHTPAWIEGRTLYTAAWKRHRAAFLAAIAHVAAQHAPAASHAA